MHLPTGFFRTTCWVPLHADLTLQTLHRRVHDGDDTVREIRISCPDATGLGCDIARMLLDFGLRILSGFKSQPWAVQQSKASAGPFQVFPACKLHFVRGIPQMEGVWVTTTVPLLTSAACACRRCVNRRQVVLPHHQGAPVGTCSDGMHLAGHFATSLIVGLSVSTSGTTMPRQLPP